MNNHTRRNFLSASVAMGVFSILPSGVWANPPNSKLSVAFVGMGGMGGGTVKQMASHAKCHVAALCDVDKTKITEERISQYPGARAFQDYREMLAQLGDTIDAVNVATPDHNHYAAAAAAMEEKKHVYCQKPLTHKISEARHLERLAKKKGVVTQMGIQLHSTTPYRTVVHYIQAGAIGKVKAVHVWSNKKWGYDGAPFEGHDPVPETLDWNLWLGAAKHHPYKQGEYHPGNWRRFLDFGCATLGDMAPHIFDTPFAALKLAAPRWAETTCREPTGFGHPMQCKVELGFKKTRYTTKDLTWTWHDGAFAPPTDAPGLVLPEGMKKLPGQGAIYIGEKGSIFHAHTAGPVFTPKTLPLEMKKPGLAPRNHYHEWIDACLGESRGCSADFDYAVPLTEALLIGVVANRFPGQRLEWNSRRMRVSNIPEANALI